jgi:hypothetical protein
MEIVKKITVVKNDDLEFPLELLDELKKQN